MLWTRHEFSLLTNQLRVLRNQEGAYIRKQVRKYSLPVLNGQKESNRTYMSLVHFYIPITSLGLGIFQTTYWLLLFQCFSLKLLLHCFGSAQVFNGRRKIFAFPFPVFDSKRHQFFSFFLIQ